MLGSTNVITSNWFVFLAIEADLERAAQFVEPVERNDNTFSVEFARLLMSTASEAEITAKILCEAIEPKGRMDNINAWRTILMREYPLFYTMEVLVPRASRKLTPWKSWGDNVNPSWWGAYNNVKHSRHRHFEQGNLINVLEAVAGLLCLQVYLHKDVYQRGSLQPWCRFLSLEGSFEIVVSGGRGTGDLPDFRRR